MPGVLTTDHPAWIETTAGARARAVRTASGVWVLSWDQEGPHMTCVQGTEDAKPMFVTTDPSCLPRSVPEVATSIADAISHPPVTSAAPTPPITPQEP